MHIKSHQYIQVLRDWHTQFFNKYLSGASGKMLDFGTGFGVAIHCAKKMGIDCVGLDIGKDFIHNHSMKRRDDYEEFQINKKIKTTVFFYDGKKAPFKASAFDYVLFRKSINKDFSMVEDYTLGLSEEKLLGQIQKRVKELVRISAPGCNWFIYPPKHFRFAQELDLIAVKKKGINLIKVKDGTAS